MSTPTPVPNESALHELLAEMQATASLSVAAPAMASERLPGEECGICRLRKRSVERWVKGYFAEYVNDEQAREPLRRAQGFCPEHSRLIGTLGDALGVAIVYSDLTRLTRERWQRQAPIESGIGRGLQRTRAQFLDVILGKSQVPSQSTLPPCPACIAAQEAEARYGGALIAGFASETVWETLAASAGLCVVHVEYLVNHAPTAHAVRLRQMEITRLEKLQAELEEIVRKNDYRFQGEAWGEERNAWLRALAKLRRER